MDLLVEKEIGSLKVKTMLQEQEEQEEEEIRNKIERLSQENRMLRKDLGCPDNNKLVSPAAKYNVERFKRESGMHRLERKENKDINARCRENSEAMRLKNEIS